MDAAQKSFEIQHQVRQNAEEFKNAMNDLYNWEKEIKDKEKQIQSRNEEAHKQETAALPVRSHIKELASLKSIATAATTAQPDNETEVKKSLSSPPTEKCDIPFDPLELKRKEANEIKDRGNKHVKMAEYKLAIDDYTQALQLYPDNAIYYTNRALCYLKLERYDDCIKDCEHAIEIDSLAVKAYYRRMLAYESLGNNMDALKDCTTVLMIDPKNIEAKRSLDRINERLRKNVKSTNGPNFTSLRTNVVDILPVDKPAYKRSTKPLRRIPIADVVGPKDSKNYENLTISDEDIDKLFNSNCGNFEEIKTTPSSSSSSSSSIVQSSVKATYEKNTSVQETKDSKIAIKKNIITPTNVTTPKQFETTSNATKRDSNKVEEKTIVTNQSSEIVRPLPPAPISTAQFYSNWKELTAQQKYDYLKSIQISQLCKILGAGFDSDTLTDVIRTLHDFYLPQRNASTSKTLLEVSKNKQVSILSLLMSNEDRKALSEIINYLKESNSLDAAAAEQVMKNFNLN